MLQFDASLVSFKTLCQHFFRLHDPTQLNRQGPDIGDQYRSAIFTVTDSQQSVAQAVLAELRAQHKDPIVTIIEPLGPFYIAEAYHQKFTERTGRGMCHMPYEPLS